MTIAGSFCENIPCTEDEMQNITARLFKGCNYDSEKIESYIENLEQLVDHLKSRYEVQVERGNIVKD